MIASGQNLTLSTRDMERRKRTKAKCQVHLAAIAYNIKRFWRLANRLNGLEHVLIGSQIGVSFSTRASEQKTHHCAQVSKHFGTIDGQEKHTLARRGVCLLGEIFCPIGEPAALDQLGLFAALTAGSPRPFSCSPCVGLTLESMSSTMPLGGRRP
jgi:hypothetical protein